MKRALPEGRGLPVGEVATSGSSYLVSPPESAKTSRHPRPHPAIRAKPWGLPKSAAPISPAAVCLRLTPINQTLPTFHSHRASPPDPVIRMQHAWAFPALVYIPFNHRSNMGDLVPIPSSAPTFAAADGRPRLEQRLPHHEQRLPNQTNALTRETIALPNQCQSLPRQHEALSRHAKPLPSESITLPNQTIPLPNQTNPLPNETSSLSNGTRSLSNDPRGTRAHPTCLFSQPADLETRSTRQSISRSKPRTPIGRPIFSPGKHFSSLGRPIFSSGRPFFPSGKPRFSSGSPIFSPDKPSVASDKLCNWSTSSRPRADALARQDSDAQKSNRHEFFCSDRQRTPSSGRWMAAGGKYECDELQSADA